MSKELAARVKAVNRANAKAIQLYKQLAEFFAEYVGQKVVKADGDLLAKIKLPKFENGNGLMIYRYPSHWCLKWVVKTCEIVDGIAYFHETAVAVGILDGNILAKLCDPIEARTDYTVEEVQAIRRDFQSAEERLRELQSRLYPFGVYDR